MITKVIEKRVFQSSLHPILLQDGGTPTSAQLNAEGYGVHFTVEGETNLEAGVFPKVTYEISHQGSTVTAVDLTPILAEGISAFRSEDFQPSAIGHLKQTKSESGSKKGDISLIATKILTVCVGCKKLQIDSTTEGMQIVRDGVEELNSPQENLTSSPKRLNILKKYEFFLKCTRKLKVERQSRLVFGEKVACVESDFISSLISLHRTGQPAPGVAFIVRRILGFFEGVVFSGVSDVEVEKATVNAGVSTEIYVGEYGPNHAIYQTWKHVHHTLYPLIHGTEIPPAKVLAVLELVKNLEVIGRSLAQTLNLKKMRT